MNLRTAHFLRQLNNQFYTEQAESFSSTRHAAWAGWEQCLNAIEASVIAQADVVMSPTKRCSAANETVRWTVSPSEDCPSDWAALIHRPCILDIACGNMRFAKYYGEFFPGREFEYVGVDSCESLADLALRDGLEYRNVDVLEGLLAGELLASKFEPADVVTCFGFMHHVPGLENRKAMIRQLVECAKPEGHVLISLWQFLNSKEMADRSQVTTNLAISELDFESNQLESGDYLLGWQNRSGAYRYCHHFFDDEILDLVQSVSDLATCITSFSADGRTGNLNRYIVLRRLP